MRPFKTSLYVVATVVTLLVACADRVFAQEDVNPSLNADFFTAVRMAYSQRPDFDPGWEFDEKRKAVVAAANANDAEKLITLGQQWLTICPVDAMTHLMVGNQ